MTGNTEISHPQPAWFTLHKAASEAGLKADTVRAWGRRYGFPRSLRAPGGSPLYSSEHVDQLRMVAGLLRAGYPPQVAVAMVNRDTGVRNPIPRRYLHPERPPDDVSRRTCEDLVESLHSLDEIAARNALLAATGSMDDECLLERVILPASRHLQRRVGGPGIRSPEISLFRHVVHTALGISRSRYANQGGPELWLACPKAESQDLELLGYAVLAAKSGWSTVLFGQNTPLECLTDVVTDPDRTSPSAILLSVTGRASLHETLPSLRRLARMVPTAVACPEDLTPQMAGTSAVWLGGGVGDVVAALPRRLFPASFIALEDEEPQQSQGL